MTVIPLQIKGDFEYLRNKSDRHSTRMIDRSKRNREGIHANFTRNFIQLFTDFG
jgi:hypothetical protein